VELGVRCGSGQISRMFLFAVDSRTWVRRVKKSLPAHRWKQSWSGIWAEQGRKLREPVLTTPASEDENSPFGVTTLILRTCRNCAEVMQHPFQMILARVQQVAAAAEPPHDAVAYD
jgi:hypothetical protein